MHNTFIDMHITTGANLITKVCSQMQQMEREEVRPVNTLPLRMAF